MPGKHPMKALIISGPFTLAELQELADTMRSIERRQPHNHYQMVVKDLEGEPSVEELTDMLDRLFPKLPGRKPHTGVINRRKH